MESRHGYNVEPLCSSNHSLPTTPNSKLMLSVSLRVQVFSYYTWILGLLCLISNQGG
jgi:hypothetical protein